MNYLQKYIQYINNNPEKYWFKRKVYGWGYSPATWQGWTILMIYVSVLLITVFFNQYVTSLKEIITKLIIPIALYTIIFLCIARKKGESLKWSWGFPKDTLKN